MLMLDCQHATRLLSQAMEARLPITKRLQLRLHLLACDACTRFKAQLGILREAMAHYRR